MHGHVIMHVVHACVCVSRLLIAVHVWRSEDNFHCPSCLRPDLLLFAIMYSSLTGLWAAGYPPVSACPFAIGTVGLKVHGTVFCFSGPGSSIWSLCLRVMTHWTTSLGLLKFWPDGCWHLCMLIMLMSDQNLFSG